MIWTQWMKISYIVKKSQKKGNIPLMKNDFLPGREVGRGWREVGLILLSTSKKTLSEYSQSIHTFIYQHRERGEEARRKKWREELSLNISVWAQDRSGKKRLNTDAQYDICPTLCAQLYVPEPVDPEVTIHKIHTKVKCFLYGVRLGLINFSTAHCDQFTFDSKFIIFFCFYSGNFPKLRYSRG